MDWSKFPIPAMRLEQRFGDRVVPAFCERPRSIWDMVARAAAKNPDAEALVRGDRRMNWREVILQSQRIAAGFLKLGLRSGDRVAIIGEPGEVAVAETLLQRSTAHDRPLQSPQ